MVICSIIPANKRKQAAKLIFISVLVMIFLSLTNPPENSGTGSKCVSSSVGSVAAGAAKRHSYFAAHNTGTFWLKCAS